MSSGSCYQYLEWLCSTSSGGRLAFFPIFKDGLHGINQCGDYYRAKCRREELRLSTVRDHLLSFLTTDKKTESNAHFPQPHLILLPLTFWSEFQESLFLYPRCSYIKHGIVLQKTHNYLSSLSRCQGNLGRILHPHICFEDVIKGHCLVSKP